LKWLKEVFIPETKPCHKGDWRLLILDGHSTHITVDFMWEAYKNRVQLLYLPAHSSHLTQPLDLALFSPLKTYYRQETSHLDFLDHAAPVMKRNFLECYDRASEKAFTSKNCRSGFRAAGIWPFEPEQVVGTEDVLEEDKEPATPPQHHSNQLFGTPHKSKDLWEQAASLKPEVNLTHNEVRLWVRIVGHSLDKKSLEIAALKHKLESIEAEMEALKPTKRRKVKEPNETFAKIWDIKAAQLKAEMAPPKEKGKELAAEPTEKDLDL
jgi:hypothetical protein